jgi:hypothetical protein
MSPVVRNVIPSSVEVIGNDGFNHCESPSVVAFEADSKLTRIRIPCFACWVCVKQAFSRASLEAMHFYCFARSCRLCTVTFGMFQQCNSLEWICPPAGLDRSPVQASCCCGILTATSESGHEFTIERRCRTRA